MHSCPTCRLRWYISARSAARPTNLASRTSGGRLCMGGQGGVVTVCVTPTQTARQHARQASMLELASAVGQRLVLTRSNSQSAGQQASMYSSAAPCVSPAQGSGRTCTHIMASTSDMGSSAKNTADSSKKLWEERHQRKWAIALGSATLGLSATDSLGVLHPAHALHAHSSRECHAAGRAMQQSTCTAAAAAAAATANSARNAEWGL